MYQLYYDEDQPNVEVKIKHLLDVCNPKEVVENARQYFNGGPPADLLINQGV